jgi:GTP-binding protein HflX
MFEVKEKPKLVERALLVGVQHQRQDAEHTERMLDELVELVNTLGIGIVGKKTVKIREPNAKFLIGKGKVEELLEIAKSLECDVIIFDEELTPAQQRNWEGESKILVIDRQEVILDIFAERAQTKEATLQVQLARMEYNLPRLKRAWTHLSRQRGGAATQRGEGEAQIELDQRMVRNKISALKKQLKEVVSSRELQRKKRSKIPIPTAAIVGYTNAGKSSMLNFFTPAKVLEEDKLFATLDPTSRRIQLPTGRTLILTDTVGFIRKLPHGLVDAFKSTLEEAIIAHFMIHVVDMNNPEYEQHIETTHQVLGELGVNETPIILAFNKLDICEDLENLERLKNRYPEAIFFSARTGENIDSLLEKMDEFLKTETSPLNLMIPHNRYDMIAKLHQEGCIQTQKAEEEGTHIFGHFPKRLLPLVESFKI